MSNVAPVLHAPAIPSMPFLDPSERPCFLVRLPQRPYCQRARDLNQISLSGSSRLDSRRSKCGGWRRRLLKC